jgi:alkanesulfonate monooxygenase SsuD/methylene tetrahydromethanopterin reductase-like flavin-dependent oxidoreductase (luciferase family)
MIGAGDLSRRNGSRGAAAGDLCPTAILSMVRGRTRKIAATGREHGRHPGAGGTQPQCWNGCAARQSAPPETVRQQLEELLEETGADEIIATAQIYDHKARLDRLRSQRKFAGS